MEAQGGAPQDAGADAALRARVRRIHVTWGILAALWVAATAAGTWWVSDKIVSRYVAEATEIAARDTKATAVIVDRILNEFRTIPRVLSSNRDVLAIVDRYNALEPAFAGLAEERRRTRLKNDPEVVRMSERLTMIRSQLNYGLVYVLDSHGILVVSSDWDRDPSFLGLKVDDREYFTQAMAGREGQMFAMARIAPDPVLFFSTPIQGDAGPIGAVVMSQRTTVIGTMLPVGHFVTLIVDSRGMVVATSHPEFYLRHVSIADRAQLRGATEVDPAPDADSLRSVYAQESLRTISMPRPARTSPIAPPVHDAERVIDGRRYLVTSDPLKAYTEYSLFVLSSLDWIETVRPLHYVIGALAALFGLLVILSSDRALVTRARRRHAYRLTVALNEKLKALNADKDRYLGIAAHDLRNPLSSIRGLSELMVENPMEPNEQKEFLTTIHRTSDEMLGLVNDLLDVSVIESGKLDLRRTEWDLGKLVRQRIAHLAPHARNKKMEIEVDAPGIQRANIDAARFGQVIDNLVSNAIKFSPAGTKVQVGLHSRDGSFVFSVQDQGPGIPEADRKLLFRSFQKLSARPTGGEKSTGLGLAIVKRIVDAHGGHIDVDSAPGRGSRFTVTAPLAPAAE